MHLENMQLALRAIAFRDVSKPELMRQGVNNAPLRR